MLVLTRKNLESVVVGSPDDLDRLLKVTVLEIRGNSVKLGFDVRQDIPVNRWEVWRKIRGDISDQTEQTDCSHLAAH